MLLAAGLRNRLVVALVALALLAVTFWVLINTPIYLLPVVSGIANLGLPGSEILPRTPLVARRCAAGDGAGPRWRVGDDGCGAASSSGLQVAHAVCRLERSAAAGEWRWFRGVVPACQRRTRTNASLGAEAHEAIHQSPKVDIERVTGNVRIDPGRNLTIAIDLNFRVPREGATDLRFSLNPAMRVDSVRLDGSDIPFEHDLGVLAVSPAMPLPPGTRAKLSVSRPGHTRSALRLPRQFGVGVGRGLVRNAHRAAG